MQVGERRAPDRRRGLGSIGSSLSGEEVFEPTSWGSSVPAIAIGVFLKFWKYSPDFREFAHVIV
jgi:hypothetical protein